MRIEFVVSVLAAAALIGGWMWYLLRLQKKLGYNPNGPDFEPQTSKRERTKPTHSPENGRGYAVLPVAPVAPLPVTNTAPSLPEPLPFATVWRVVRDAVHVLIVGETHSGKSTSARAVLAGRIQAGDEIVIFDPHSTPSTWGGLPAIGAGRDFAAIERGMLAVLSEMTTRYEAMATDETFQPEPLTIFVDEWPAIQSHCKKIANQFITELAQEGRKAGMRLVMLTQSDLVASLGIEGKGDVRSNFIMVLLGAKALDRCPESHALLRPAALRRGEGGARAAITDQFPIYEQGLDTRLARRWHPKQSTIETAHQPEPEPSLDPLWQRFLNGDSLLEPENELVHTRPNVPTNAPTPTPELVHQTAVLPDTDAVRTGSEHLPADDLSVAIRALVHAGLSRNKVLTLLSISGGRAEQLRRVKVALGEQEGGISA